MSKSRRDPQPAASAAGPAAASTQPEVRLEVRAGIPVIFVSGNVTKPDAEPIYRLYHTWYEGLDRERARRNRTVIVDLTEVHYCGSWVILNISRIHREIEDRIGRDRAQVLLTGVQDGPARVFEMLGVASFFPRFGTVEDALDALRRKKKSPGSRSR